MGIQNPSELPGVYEVYKDDLVTLWLHDIEMKGEILVLHVNVIPTTNRQILKHYSIVFADLLESLRERGIRELEAWTSTPTETRFAQFFGFELLGELTIDGKPTIPVIDRLRIRF